MSGSFSIGDTVQLKSGGPPMTVKELMSGGYMTGQYLCQWFGGQKLQQGYFPYDSLRKIADQSR